MRAEVDDAMERVRGDLTEKGFAPALLQRLAARRRLRASGLPPTPPAKTLDKVIDDRLLEFKVDARGGVSPRRSGRR